MLLWLCNTKKSDFVSPVKSDINTSSPRNNDLPHCSVIRRIWESARSTPWRRLQKRARCPSSTPQLCTCPVPTARRAWRRDRRLSKGKALQHSSAPPSASPRLSLQSEESLRSATTAKSKRVQTYGRFYDYISELVSKFMTSSTFSGWYYGLRTSFWLQMLKDSWRSSAARTAWRPSTTRKTPPATWKLLPPPPLPRNYRQ